MSTEASKNDAVNILEGSHSVNSNITITHACAKQPRQRGIFIVISDLPKKHLKKKRRGGEAEQVLSRMPNHRKCVDLLNT